MEDVDVPVYPNSEYGDSALPYTQFTLGFEERVATFESNSARVVVSVHKSEFAATTPMETNDAWYDAVLPDHIFSLLRETREAGEGCESVSVSRRRRGCVARVRIHLAGRGSCDRERRIHFHKIFVFLE
jgi:hypothetical protein